MKMWHCWQKPTFLCTNAYIVSDRDWYVLITCVTIRLTLLLAHHRRRHCMPHHQNPNPASPAQTDRCSTPKYRLIINLTICVWAILSYTNQHLSLSQLSQSMMLWELAFVHPSSTAKQTPHNNIGMHGFMTNNTTCSNLLQRQEDQCHMCIYL